MHWPGRTWSPGTRRPTVPRSRPERATVVDSYLELIRAVDHPAFGVHLDPANMFYSPRQCFESGVTIRDACRRLGPWIASCHAKDLTIRPGLALHVDECIPGTGLLDYRAYVAALGSLGRDVPLMLEHLTSEADYRRAADFVRDIMGGTGRGVRPEWR